MDFATSAHPEHEISERFRTSNAAPPDSDQGGPQSWADVKSPPSSLGIGLRPALIQAKLWTAEDEVRYPAPKPVGDPLITVVRKQQVYDVERCRVWKDEIDNLLIFAGLFSGIVTAFTLEATKRLQVDHQESTSTILLAIHQQLDSIARQNASSLPSLVFDPADSFRAPDFAIQVNACWYLSLTLSLTAVLMGILCLQWLREHLKASSEPPEMTEGPSSPSLELDVLTRNQVEQFVILRALQIRGLDQCGVPAIVSCLPILLVAALLLFFAGLLIFLWNLNKLVAIATSVIIGAASIFLLTTSLLPVVDRQSALRSPQARLLQWIFYWLSLGGLISAMVIIWLAFAALSFVTSVLSPIIAIVLYRVFYWDESAIEQSREKMKGATETIFGHATDGIDAIVRYWPQSPEDWRSVDQRAAVKQIHASESNHPLVHWGWYTTALSRDPGAVLAFVHRVSATSDARILVRQMSSLLRHSPLPGAKVFKAVDWDDLPQDLPLEKSEALGRALCMAYAAKAQPLSIIPLLQSRLEAVLMLTNPYPLGDIPLLKVMMEDLLRDIGWGQSSTSMTTPALRDVISMLPDDFLYQARTALWETLTQRETTPAEVSLRVELSIYLEPDFREREHRRVPEVIKALNSRLEATLKSEDGIKSDLLVGNVADYIYYWRTREWFDSAKSDSTIAGLMNQFRLRHRGSWPQEIGTHFQLLAEAVNVEMSKPRNTELQHRETPYSLLGDTWIWREFVKREFDLDPLQLDHEVYGSEGLHTAPYVAIDAIPAD